MYVEHSDVGNGLYSPAGDLSCGDFATRYLVYERLSEGTFRGRYVHAGLRQADEKQVAVECVPINQCQIITSGMRRLPLEVALREKVNRPYRCENVVEELLDWVVTPNFLILVLDRPSSCMDLQSFHRRYIQQFGQLPEKRVRKIIYQVFRGVHHCFECGVPYLDFNPVNLQINVETWEVKLNGFGCSSFLMNEPYSNYAGALYFCPPEWFLTGNYCAGPATVWKMGVLKYWLLFGDYPFKSMGDWQLHYPFNVEVSGDCLSLISGCLKEDPEERLKFDQILDHMYFLA